MMMESPTQTAEHIESMTEFLVSRYSDKLYDISLSLPIPNFTTLSSSKLVDDNPYLARLLFSNPEQYLRHFDDSAILAHKIALEHIKKFFAYYAASSRKTQLSSLPETVRAIRVGNRRSKLCNGFTPLSLCKRYNAQTH